MYQRRRIHSVKILVQFVHVLHVRNLSLSLYGYCYLSANNCIN